ncbi:hypothetical protein GF377_00195 [candidate division GN15 bacterium]|nr:hypothetical protein [candidate division GN15 bacterium]
MDSRKFKQCPKCDEWFSVHDILDNPDIQPTGMTFEDLESLSNLFFFNHNCEHCGTTFAIPVTEFGQYIHENIPPQPLTGTDKCNRHCLSIDDLSECGAECLFAPYRRFLLAMIRRRELNERTQREAEE